jgi:Flp pilus assembly pilin Flp
VFEDKFLTTDLLGEREMRTLKRFFKDERGLEGSEYALLLALICLAIIVGVKLLSDAIANRFTSTADTINTGYTAS